MYYFEISKLIWTIIEEDILDQDHKKIRLEEDHRLPTQTISQALITMEIKILVETVFQTI